MRFLQILVLPLPLVSFASCDQVVFSTEQRILTPEIDEFISNLLDEWNSPAGISIAVVQKRADGSWNTETKGYGIANAAGEKVTPDTLFAIGSNSKLFDVIAAGLLISNTSLSPQISWDTKLTSILPDWKLMDPMASAETTIVDAMSHRTGLPRHDFMYGKNESVSSIIKRLRYLKPSAGFRATWQYCNNMYTVLSYLPQILLGVHFEDYVKTYIFDPLGLNSTTYSYEVAKRTGYLANGIGREGVNKSEDLFGKGIPRPMEYWNKEGGETGSFISGAGGVLTNAKNVSLWLQTLLQNGLHPLTNESVIPAAVIQKALTGVSVVSGVAAFPELSPVVYGGGQGQFSYRGHVIIEHGGGTPGFLSTISRLPYSPYPTGIAVFSNDDSFGSFLVEIIKYRIIDTVVLDPTLQPPIDWNKRFKDIIKQVYTDKTTNTTPPPKNQTPPLVPFEQLEGVYTDLGYGNVELCCLPPSEARKEWVAFSPSCTKLINDLPTILPGALPKSHEQPVFIAEMNRLFGSHLLFEHFDGDLFNITVLDSRPTINSTQPYWALIDDNKYLATFAKVNGEIGFAVNGNAWGAEPGVSSPLGDTLEERAEIWFSKDSGARSFEWI